MLFYLCSSEGQDAQAEEMRRQQDAMEKRQRELEAKEKRIARMQDHLKEQQVRLQHEQDSARQKVAAAQGRRVACVCWRGMRWLFIAMECHLVCS